MITCLNPQTFGNLLPTHPPFQPEVFASCSVERPENSTQKSCDRLISNLRPYLSHPASPRPVPPVGGPSLNRDQCTLWSWPPAPASFCSVLCWMLGPSQGHPPSFPPTPLPSLCPPHLWPHLSARLTAGLLMSLPGVFSSSCSPHSQMNPESVRVFKLPHLVLLPCSFLCSLIVLKIYL